jgi:hypothetical protein
LEGLFESMTIQTTFEGCDTELTSHKPPLSNEQFLVYMKMSNIATKKNSIILGDINIDYLKGENSDVFTHFCAAGLDPIIDQPTRITQNSKIYIDPIFTNMRGTTGFILECDISDHLAVGLLPDCHSKAKQ